MKEKLNKKNIIFFALVFIVTIATATVFGLLGASKVTTVASTALLGIIAFMCVGAYYEIKKKNDAPDPEAGIIAAAIGTLLSIFVF